MRGSPGMGHVTYVVLGRGWNATILIRRPKWIIGYGVGARLDGHGSWRSVKYYVINAEAKHGTVSRYTHQHCRCDDCRRAYAGLDGRHVERQRGLEPLRVG
jgi:hypothetical protein